jgi:serine/threonine protein kinase/tetratricopeptide (TPR) repeat protein
MQTIGRYQLQEKLGQGGMGVVYRAFDSLIERVVAIKVISSPIEPNPEMRERFFREARAAGQLSHKNIITIHDLGEHEGQPYLAMEYLDGEDLQRRLRRPEKMSLSRKLDLAIDICEGLEYAHSRGVVHRDVKPANIFITERGTVKVLDFGLARLVTSQLTNTNMLMGTLNYMAPEQVRGERADHRSDIFSVGVVIYELLSGKKAFEGDSFASTLYKILQEVPEPLWKIDSTLPRELIAIVERSLAKPKDERYQQMSELRADLVTYRQILHADSIVTGPVSVPSRPSSDAKRLSAVDADLTQPVDTPITPPSGGPGSGGPGSGRPGTGGPGTPGPGSGGPGSGPALAVPGSGGVPSTASMPAPSRLPLIATVGVAALAIVVVWMWIAQRRSTPQPPPATAATPEAPVDPTAAALRQARASLEAKDYASAQKFAEAILVTAPDQAEARQIRDTARDQQVQAALRTAQEHLAAGDFAEASRAAGAVLALDPGNAEAKRITEQGSVRERTRAADEGRTRMNEARVSALAAGATRMAPAAFRAATRVDQDAQRLYKAGRLSEAMSRFYEASGLYRSAETTANSEAALQRSTPPAPHTAPATPPASPPSIPPPSTSPTVPAPTVDAPEETAKPQVTAPATPAPPPATKPPEPLPPPPAAPAPSTRPLPSPPVAQPLDLPARSPTAEERIQELLSRYKSAMESRSLEDLKRIWPGLGGAQLDALRRQFQEASSISVDVIDPHIQLTGATGTSATVTFTRHYVVTFSGQARPEQSDSRTVMEVRRNGNAWVIDSMRFR